MDGYLLTPNQRALIVGLIRACRDLIRAREKSNMTDFWAAIGRIAQALELIEDNEEAEERCTP